MQHKSPYSSLRFLREHPVTVSVRIFQSLFSAWDYRCASGIGPPIGNRAFPVRSVGVQYQVVLKCSNCKAFHARLRVFNLHFLSWDCLPVLFSPLDFQERHFHITFIEYLTICAKLVVETAFAFSVLLVTQVNAAKHKMTSNVYIKTDIWG